MSSIIIVNFNNLKLIIGTIGCIKIETVYKIYKQYKNIITIVKLFKRPGRVTCYFTKSIRLI